MSIRNPDTTDELINKCIISRDELSHAYDVLCRARTQAYSISSSRFDKICVASSHTSYDDAVLNIVALDEKYKRLLDTHYKNLSELKWNMKQAGLNANQEFVLWHRKSGDYGDETFKQLATYLGISENACISLYKRAYNKLHKYLSEEKNIHPIC